MKLHQMTSVTKTVQNKPHLTWNIKAVLKVPECISKARRKLKLQYPLKKCLLSHHGQSAQSLRYRRLLHSWGNNVNVHFFALSLLFFHILKQNFCWKEISKGMIEYSMHVLLTQAEKELQLLKQKKENEAIVHMLLLVYTLLSLSLFPYSLSASTYFNQIF